MQIEQKSRDFAIDRVLVSQLRRRSSRSSRFSRRIGRGRLGGLFVLDAVLLVGHHAQFRIFKPWHVSFAKMFAKLRGVLVELLAAGAPVGTLVGVLLHVDLELELVQEGQVAEPADPRPIRLVNGLQVRLESVELVKLVGTMKAVVDLVILAEVFQGLGVVVELFSANVTVDSDRGGLGLVLGFDV